MKDSVMGLLDCHTAPELGELTAHRTLGSTSFLGRYAFADFALSDFCNSGISKVGILIKDRGRSMLAHLGSRNAWLTNTKISSDEVLYNEKGFLNPPFNHDINNIRENDWVLYDSNASYLVFMSSHIILDIDLRKVLDEHISRKEQITLVYKKIEDADEEFTGENVFEIGEDGYVASVAKNPGNVKKANVSCEIWVVNRTMLADIIKKNSLVNPLYGMKEMLGYCVKAGLVKVWAHEYVGYARCVDSLKHYVDYSLELLNRDVAVSLFKPDWTIYTLTNDTPPALYGESSKVVNSFVANGSLIDGTVIDSVISRNVKIGPSSVIRHCVILSNASIGDHVSLENVVVDKYAVITQRHDLSGTSEVPLYVKQGAII